MQSDEIRSILEASLESCEVQAQVDGSHVSILVISPAFEGLNSVKKQQLVYGVLADHIADGSIHAVNMKTYTPGEWQQLNS